MKLIIRVRGIESIDELRTRVVRRVHFALARLLTAGSRVAVALSDVNGPRGGRDKRVLIRVTTPGRPEVVIQEDGVDAAATVDRAVDRAARSCARVKERGNLGAAVR